MKAIYKTILFTLKLLVYTLVLGGGLLVLGSIGAFENDYISWLQFFVQEFIAAATIFLGFMTFVGRETLKDKFVADMYNYYN